MIFGLSDLTAKKKEGFYSYFFPTSLIGSISLSGVLKLVTAYVHHKRLRMRESFSVRHFNGC